MLGDLVLITPHRDYTGGAFRAEECGCSWPYVRVWSFPSFQSASLRRYTGKQYFIEMEVFAVATNVEDEAASSRQSAADEPDWEDESDCETANARPEIEVVTER